jgi:hypothetical protein
MPASTRTGRTIPRSDLIDLAGKRFGRWRVIADLGYLGGRGQRYWLCRCDCGTERPVQGQTLREGRSRSCGPYTHWRRIA